jgi:hypothetical protein
VAKSNSRSNSPNSKHLDNMSLFEVNNKLLVDQIAASRNNNHSGFVNSTALSTPTQPAAQKKSESPHLTANHNNAVASSTLASESSNSNLSLAFQKYGKDQPQPQQQSGRAKEAGSGGQQAAGGSGANLGVLHFSVEYIPTLLQLKINLISASDLPACDSNGFSDPYVKLHLLPGIAKATKLRSKTIYKNLNPTFNETFHYDGVTVQDIENKTLRYEISCQIQKKYE